MALSSQQLLIRIAAQNATQAAFGQVNSALDGLGRKALQLAATIGGALAFKNVIDSVNNLGQEIDLLRDNMGISAEQASKLNFILRAVGSSAEEFDQSFAQLTNRIAEQIPLIAKGTSVFDKYGIKLMDITGAIDSSEAALVKIRGVLQTLPAGFARTGAAGELMGQKVGRKLLDFFMLTDAQLLEFTKDAERMGLVLSEAGVDSLEQFQRELNVMNLEFDAVKLQIGQYIIPILRGLFDWLRRNSGGIKVIGEVIGRALGVFKQWFEWIRGIWDQLKGLLSSLGSVELATNALILVLAAMAGGPVLAAIAAVVLAFMEVKKTIQFISDNWETFVLALRTGRLNDIPVFGGIFHLAQIALQWFDDLNAKWTGFTSALAATAQADIPVLSGLVSALQNVALWIGQIQNQWNVFIDTLINAVPGLRLALDILGALGGALAPKGGGGGAPGGDRDTGGRGGGGGSQDRLATLDDIYAAFTRNHGFMPEFDYAKAILNMGLMWSQVQGLASGGIVTRPTMAMVGESGPEAVIPLSRASGIGNITINVSGNIASSERELADMIGDVVMRRLLSQRAMSF